MVKKKSTASKILGPHRGVPGTKRGLKCVTPRYDSTPKNLETWQKQVDMKNYSKRLFGTITIQVYCIYINECVIYIYICINRYTPVSTYMCIKRWMQGLNPKKAPKSCTLFHSLRVSNLRPNLLENLQAPRYGNAGPFPDDTNSGQKRRFLGWLEH